MQESKMQPWWWITLTLANIVGICVPLELFLHTEGKMQALAALFLMSAAFFLLITDVITAIAARFGD